jgi:hypothetical protein
MKTPKKVWVSGELWNVVNHIQPNKHQDFLLLQRETDSGFDDGTMAVDYWVIDCHNVTYMPDSADARDIVKKKYPPVHNVLRDKETTIWLKQLAGRG